MNVGALRETKVASCDEDAHWGFIEEASGTEYMGLARTHTHTLMRNALTYIHTHKHTRDRHTRPHTGADRNTLTLSPSL